MVDCLAPPQARITVAPAGHHVALTVASLRPVICTLSPSQAKALARDLLDVAGAGCDLDDNDRIIAEYDENLCGSRLTPAEKAEFTAARKRAYIAKHPETALGQNQHTRVSQAGEPTAPRFTADTAAKTGQSERTIRGAA